MRQRLSPRDTTVVAILGWEGWCAWEDPSARSSTERFATTVSGTSNGTAARDRTTPELDSTSASATTTFCLDVACLPSACLDLNVSSYSPRGSRGGVMTNCPD